MDKEHAGTQTVRCMKDLGQVIKELEAEGS